MTKTSSITARIDEDLKERVQAIAALQDRSTSYVTEKALERYLDVEEAQIQGIHEAIAQADRGEVVPDNDMREWIESIGTADELPKPAS